VILFHIDITIIIIVDFINYKVQISIHYKFIINELLFTFRNTYVDIPSKTIRRLQPDLKENLVR